MAPARLLAAAAVFAALLALVLVWFQATGSPRSEVVGGSPSQEGWKTLEYDGVRVDIPSAWERLDTDDCEFQFERWARPDSPPCDFEEGVAFYDSSTFDPARGPGVRRTTENGIPAWGGYIRVGDFAIYASYGDRDLVRSVLASARVAR
jgi:hypothetical protein